MHNEEAAVWRMRWMFVTLHKALTARCTFTLTRWAAPLRPLPQPLTDQAWQEMQDRNWLRHFCLHHLKATWSLASKTRRWWGDCDKSSVTTLSCTLTITHLLLTCLCRKHKPMFALLTWVHKGSVMTALPLSLDGTLSHPETICLSYHCHRG